MTYKTIYIQPDSFLARARAQSSSRDITVLASQKLVQGVLDEGIADTLKKFQASGWPSRSGAGNKRLAVWVRPACLLYLEKLSQTHHVSMLRTITAWMEFAAHQMGATTAQAAQSDQPSQPTATVFAPPSLPLTAPPPVAVARIPEPIVEVATTRTIQGRVQHFFACPRHRLMTSEQMSEVFQHGGLWLDQPMHTKAMANGWTLDELLGALVQNPVMSSNVIAMPAPQQTPTVTPVSSAPAGRDYSGDFFQAAMAMFDPERKAA